MNSCRLQRRRAFAGLTPTRYLDVRGRFLREHPGHPLADRGRLAKEIDAARRKHLAFDLAEHGIGISAVGVAVVDPFGRPVAVSIPAPTHRFVERRVALSAALLSFREKLRTNIGK